MNIAAYLSRIGIDRRDIPADVNSLRLLQRQHLLSVPFENLDIHWNRPIVLDTESFHQKIVGSGRGGFCYELNGSFNELIRELGFETRLLSARVANADGEFSPEYDHLVILVIIGEMQYLADVGFGSFSTEPLQFVGGVEQTDDAGIFMVRRQSEEYFDVAKKDDGAWKSEYMFKPFGHDLSEFAERCKWQQESPDSHFKQKKICSILTVNGRKTLTDSKFIVTTGDEKTETAVGSDGAFDRLLLEEFGITRPVEKESQIGT